MGNDYLELHGFMAFPPQGLQGFMANLALQGFAAAFPPQGFMAVLTAIPPQGLRGRTAMELPMEEWLEAVKLTCSFIF